MEKHLKLLGFEVRDMVTGFEGVVSGISFDLYGCVQAAVHPKQDKDGKLPDGVWFDTKRLNRQSKEPVMQVPTFSREIPGGQDLARVRSPLIKPR